MAIQIDLLPGYVKLKKNLHRSIAGCIVVTGLIFSGLLVLLQQRKLELETVQKDRDTWQAVASKTTAAESARDAATSSAAPITTSVGFMTGALKTGPQRAALLYLINQFINADTIVDSIDASTGTSVTINATVRDPDQYAAFLLNLRAAADVNGGTLFKGLPTASGPGGFANGAAPFIPPLVANEPVPIVYPVKVTATGTLLYPIQLPPEPGGGAAAPAPGDPTAPPVP